MSLIQNLKYSLNNGTNSIFSKWNKDKIMSFYNSPDLKMKLYLKGHGKILMIENFSIL